MVSYTELTVLSTIQFTRFLKEKTDWGKKKKGHCAGQAERFTE